MPEKKTARNRLIARLYSRESRNGQKLADRFGVTRNRIRQIVKEYSVIERKPMSAKTGRLPVIMIEAEKECIVREIAASFDVSVATIIRWGIDAMIEKHQHKIVIPDPDPDLSKGTL